MDPAKYKSKWEKLMTDFKKVYDYDKGLGSGLVSYYELTYTERESKDLPKKISKEFFDLFVSWVCDSFAVDPTEINVMDSGIPPVESENVEGLESENQTCVIDLTDNEGNTMHSQSRRKGVEEII
jgi:hypothetical protein